MNNTTLQASLVPGWRDYVALCKPRVVSLIVFTALIGMLLATPALPPLSTIMLATLGIALAASSAAAINQVAEHRIDALMSRTRHRPLVQGEVRTTQALVFALILGALAMYILVVFVNALTAILTFVSLIGYAVVYTMFLKHATPQNIVIGGAAGAAPPVLGWTAVTGHLAPHALLLFLIIFAWTPPHFWALAIYRRNDYAKAEIPMLPITHGVDFTRRHVLLYTVLLTAITVMPYATFMCGPIYLVGALLLDAGFLYYAIRMQFDARDQLAFGAFKYSIVYLTLLFVVLFVDHYALAMQGFGS